MMLKRDYSLIDRLCIGFDHAMRTLTNKPETSGAPNPAQHLPDNDMSDKERKLSANLMRVNHAGEICAQALYHGQSMVSFENATKEKMLEAAIEEGDHLAWCKSRLDELNSHPSYLSPLWYMGSFCIGMMAGIIGDKWSLGFVAETETQVIKHLDGHLKRLPRNDYKSLAILEQMEQDETKHRDEAIKAGAYELPGPIKVMMTFTSKIMVKTAYYL